MLKGEAEIDENSPPFGAVRRRRSFWRVSFSAIAAPPPGH